MVGRTLDLVQQAVAGVLSNKPELFELLHKEAVLHVLLIAPEPYGVTRNRAARLRLLLAVRVSIVK